MTTLQDAIVDVSQGNPGALTVCLGIWESHDDPTVAAAMLLWLMNNGPKGPDLWILYKDENNEDIKGLIMDLELEILLGGE